MDTSSSQSKPTKKTKQKREESEVGMRWTLPESEYTTFEEYLAMHYYVTGSNFEDVEEPHLLAALRILDPSIRLPSSNRLREIALENSIAEVGPQ